jgi:hypothetical protein
MRIRANSTLANLSEDQLNEIFERIAAGERYRDVQKHCAAPPPDGFGIHINLKTLSHFYKSERRRRHAEELAEARFLKLDSEDPSELLQNVKVELAHACFDLANDPQPTAINALSRVTHRIEVVRLEQQRIHTEEQRLALERDLLIEKIREFNYNAARAAAKHAAQIHKVIETKGPDAEDKTWMVSDIVFGPSPKSQTHQLSEKTNS